LQTVHQKLTNKNFGQDKKKNVEKYFFETRPSQVVLVNKNFANHEFYITTQFIVIFLNFLLSALADVGTNPTVVVEKIYYFQLEYSTEI